MTGREHTTIQSVIQIQVEKWNHGKPPGKRIKAHIEAEIAREVLSASPTNSASIPRSRTTCLRADIAVGPLLSSEQIENLPDIAKKCHFPPDVDPPMLVIEITSPSNSFNDLITKVSEYPKRGIQLCGNKDIC